jgi:hypothetical protein
MTPPRWTEAGGALQVPFMLAAGRLLKGEQPACPKCGAAQLRHYFHAFDRGSGRGSFWVWCGTCGSHTHLPRVASPHPPQPDPYAALDIDAFAGLEMQASPSFLDRLDGLWQDGALASDAAPGETP